MPTHLKLAFASLVLLIACAPACIADDTPKLPTWKPDPKIVAGLGPDYTLYGSAIRFPQTFTLKYTKEDGKTDIRIWDGFEYENGFHAELLILCVPLNGRELAPDQLLIVQGELLKLGREGLASQFDDWIQSSTEHGQVNTQLFDRLYFKAFDQRVLKEIHGFVYTTATDKCVYGFFTADTEPYNKMSLPVLEASVLTFHPSDADTEPIPQDVLNHWPDDNHDE